MNYSCCVADAASLEAIGSTLARHSKPPLLIYLSGQLGAGKTTLARGFLRGFGYQGKVKSPTYTLVEPYTIGQQLIYHFDLYRLVDPEELAYMGIRDYFTATSICLVEWPEHGSGILPTPDLTCQLALALPGRQLTITATSTRGAALLAALSQKS